MYKGQSGMWSWILHRVTGLGILLFLLVHIFDISLLGFGPKIYNDAISIFSYPVVRVGSMLLIGAVIYHSFNGVRIILVDFWPKGAKYQKQMWGVVLITSVIVTAAMAIFVLGPIVGWNPQA